MVAISIGLAAVGCAHKSVQSVDLVPIVKKKASFELACPEAQLTVTELSDTSQRNAAGATQAKTFGVEGCGTRATYDGYCVKGMMMKRTCDARQQSAPTASPTAADQQ